MYGENELGNFITRPGLSSPSALRKSDGSVISLTLISPAVGLVEAAESVKVVFSTEWFAPRGPCG